MGNVISIHAEIFVKKGVLGQSLKPAEVLWQLTEPMNGRSYNGYPMIIKEIGGVGSSIRISYGEKYEPQRVFSFFEENESYIDRLFARTHYEGGDWDYIFNLPSQNTNFEEIRRKCRYGFDEILFKTEENIDLIDESYEVFDEYKSIKLCGDMNSISCLVDIDNTELISFPIEHERSLKTYALNEFKCVNENLLNIIIDQSCDVIFKYKNRTVHRKIDTQEHISKGYEKSLSDFMAIKYNGGKYDIYSSGWQNCVDTEYLDYTKTIGRAPNT